MLLKKHLVLVFLSFASFKVLSDNSLIVPELEIPQATLAKEPALTEVDTNEKLLENISSWVALPVLLFLEPNQESKYNTPFNMLR
ncbi:MAG: hypothetical protein KC505_06485 [Myxococcales bacterium]|nr:hypothetical protein [Myxococcales bacterium]USN51052.1 MAG: hypothetical protein H6731_01180 [Myxococcales bacterium]